MVVGAVGAQKMARNATFLVGYRLRQHIIPAVVLFHVIEPTFHVLRPTDAFRTIQQFFEIYISGTICIMLQNRNLQLDRLLHMSLHQVLFFIFYIYVII